MSDIEYNLMTEIRAMNKKLDKIIELLSERPKKAVPPITNNTATESIPIYKGEYWRDK